MLMKSGVVFGVNKIKQKKNNVKKYLETIIFRPEKFSEWSVDKWKDLSDPDWRNQTEPSKKTCFVKNYDYDQVRN